jgi:DNA repair protein RadD
MKTVALRDYQQKGILDIRAAMRSARSVLYVAPTGSGKTVLFVFIAQSAIALGNRVWILVHRQELLFQTSRSLDALGVSHGVVAPGFTPAPHELVQVCSVQTLRNRILQGRIGDVDLVVIDEAHHATAGSWRTILEARPRARFLGVTATPSRADGNGLGVAAGGVFDVMTLGPSVAHLMAEGYLCKAAVFAPPSQLDLTNLRLRGGDYEPKALAERVDRPTITGDAVSHYRRVCSGQPAIAFCASVAHAKHVAEQFRAAGFRSESIDGSMADTDRKRLIDALGTGKMHVLTSCEIVSEGTDIPVVAAAILLRPTQSLALHLQQVGRALRPVYVPGANVATREGRLSAIASSAKPRAVILDHVGNTLRHGLPDEGWEWSLEGKPKRGGGEGSGRRCASSSASNASPRSRPRRRAPCVDSLRRRRWQRRNRQTASW